MRSSDWSSDVFSSDLAIDLVNISQSGAGFRSAIPLEAGALVNLVLPNAEKRRPALVRWARGLCAGLWFTQPIERSLLASIDRLRLPEVSGKFCFSVLPLPNPPQQIGRGA